MAIVASNQPVESNSAPVDAALPAARRRWSWRILLAVVAAVAAIAVSDHLLRQYEDVVSTMTAAEEQTPTLLPFSDTLRDKVSVKMNWWHLLDQRENAIQKGKPADVIKADDDIAAFISQHIDPADPRRRDVLLSLVDAYPEDPASLQAYEALLESPSWQLDLAPRRGQFAASIVKIAASDPDSQADTLLSFVQYYQDAGDSVDQLALLRALRQAGPINFRSVGAMKLLATMLPASDPDRGALDADLASYAQRRANIEEIAEEYSNFVKQSPAQRNAAAPEWASEQPPTPFGAAWDVVRIRQDLISGNFDEATALRKSLATMPLADLPEYEDAMMQLPEARQASASLNPSTPAPVQLPETQITFERWRGLVVTRNPQASKPMTNPANNKPLFPVAKSLLAMSQGHPIKGDSTCKFAAVDPSTAPQAIQDALSGAPTTESSPVPQSSTSPDQDSPPARWLHMQLKLAPYDRAIPKDITSTVDFWLAGDQLAIEFWAKDPRDKLPPVKAHDAKGKAWSDESFDLGIDPDGAAEGYWRLAVNRNAIVTTAGAWGEPGEDGTTDLHQSLSVKATVQPKQGGWDVVLVVPRQRLFASNELLHERAVIPRLAVIRRRQVTESGQTVVQIYCWPSRMNNVTQPARFGWTIWP